MAAGEMVAADEIRVAALEIGRDLDIARQNLGLRARRIALDDVDDAVGIGLLRGVPVARRDLAGGIAAIRAGSTRTWTQRMCFPSGARDGSIAVGWPTTSTGSAGSRPAIASE